MMYSFRIEQAIRAASILHDGQVRKGSVPYPYIAHLIAVAYMLADYSDDEDVIIAGFLHDTLEDTSYTPEEIEADFGTRVRSFVEGVTNTLFSERVSTSWNERQERYFNTLEGAPHECLLIACADKIHNMRSIVEEYHSRIDDFLTDFDASPKDIMDKYNRLQSLFSRKLRSNIADEFDSVHSEYQSFLKNAQNVYDEKNKTKE